MNPDTDYDVLIAGAGLVGAALAAALANSDAGAGLRIALVEPRPFRSQPGGEHFDPRVVALTEASRQLLLKAGVWQRMPGMRLCPYRQMQVRDADGVGSISFDCASVRQPDLGHIVENTVLQAALLDSIAELPPVQLLCPAGITATERVGGAPGEEAGIIHVQLDNGQIVKTGLLVAADGARSRVRESFGFKLRNWDYRHDAIVATIETERDHRFIARQWFLDTGPLAFLPLRDDSGACRAVSIVWSQLREQAGRLMALTDGDFCRALDRASEGSLGRVMAVGKRYSFPLRQQHAVDYVQPGVALAGDSAHTIHPLAGQGVNLGFQDVRVLVEEVNRNLKRGLVAGHSLGLQRYQRRRKPENLGMMAAMEAFKQLFEQSSPAIRLLRNEGMSALDGIGSVKRRIIRMAMGC